MYLGNKQTIPNHKHPNKTLKFKELKYIIVNNSKIHIRKQYHFLKKVIDGMLVFAVLKDAFISRE